MPLSKQGKTALAFLKRGLSEGLSPTKIYETLRGTPLGYRKTTCLSDIRSLAGLSKKAEGIKYVPKKYRPSERILSKAPAAQTKSYIYEFEMTGYDQSPKKETTIQRALGMDELMSIGKAEEVMTAIMKEHGYVVHNITVVAGWRR